MSRYRAVYLVPTIIEFENPGSPAHVAAHARQLTAAMQHVKSCCDAKKVYEPVLAETAVIAGVKPEPPIDPLEEQVAPGFAA